MQLHELAEQVAGFDTAPPRERIKLFAWWLHTHGGKELFAPTDIRTCFDKLHIEEPPALATYVTRMAQGKDLLKENGQFKLARCFRAEFDKKYGVHHTVVAVRKILTDLPAQMPNVAERAFLNEALKCYRIEAFRSCIVMTWNLAYSHLLDWILQEPTRLATFNAAISRRYPRLSNIHITTYDDFLDELKESQVIEICNTANLFSSNVFKILKEKLDKRNIAAHPSAVVIVQSQADDVITDLVNNVVLALTR
jgi:hypothetical protein